MDVIKFPMSVIDYQNNGELFGSSCSFEEQGLSYWVGWDLSFPIDSTHEFWTDVREKPDDCHVPEEERLYGYDPRCRPWYEDSFYSPNKVNLIEPYLFDGVMFFTFSQALLDEQDEVVGVDNIDLNISELSLNGFNETYFVIGA
jgi:hypothetical protein